MADERDPTVPAPPMCEYAPLAPADPGDRLVRLVLAWFAILHGSIECLGDARYYAIRAGWMTGRFQFLFHDGWDAAIDLGRLLVYVALCACGILILLRRRCSIVALRGTLVCWIVIKVVRDLYDWRIRLRFPDEWSNPPLWIEQLANLLSGYWLPVLILCLTLRPVARRLV